MLLAVTKDGQNQILPVAYGICKNEYTDSWTWFFQKLHDCIGNMQELTIISDRSPSIATSVANIFPHAHHGICGVHLYFNIVSRFGKSKTVKGIFWEACRAYTVDAFDAAMDVMKKTKEPVWEYLKSINPETWSRAHFKGNRYNLMSSNSAESINALSRHARKVPILMLIDFFRATMQQWWFQRRNFAGIT